MDFKELVLKRQSDRKYKADKVEKEKIEMCIEASRLAPSACNSQPWTFIVVNDEDLVKEIGKAVSGLGMNTFAKTCPCFVAIVMEKPNFSAKLGCVMKDKDFPLIDIGIAASSSSYLAWLSRYNNKTKDKKRQRKDVQRKFLLIKIKDLFFLFCIKRK
jgi:nitroreductase